MSGTHPQTAAPQRDTGRKQSLSKFGRLLRLIGSTLDPRAWAHVFKLVNYYNYSHVQPLRKVTLGPDAAISPTAVFSNPERISAGRGLRLGARCTLWAGHQSAKIIIGDDVLFGPEVMVTAASYRYNDGQPVTKQLMDEADVVIGNDVWLGTRAVILPGTTIGDGAVIAAHAVVSGKVEPMSIVAGVPARKVSTRKVASSLGSTD